MASKELCARQKQDQLVQLASQAEKARQDAVAAAQEQMEVIKQNYRVSATNINISTYLVH